MNWLYLALNLGSVAIPLAFSFDKRINFYKKWNALLPALMLTAAFFLLWDFWFTAKGVWQFNPDYVLGLNLFNLPFEEWMFFLFIPYACMFIHESLKYHFREDPFEKYGKIIALAVSLPLLMIAVAYNDRLYTAVTFLLLGVLLLFNAFVLKADFMGRFFLTYLVSLLPFAIVNGILTGMPVLIYNNSENLALRVGSIPLEDFFYSMLMLLMNVTIFELLMDKRKIRLSYLQENP